MMKMPQAVILAGGLATRLGDIAQTTPKALLPIGDRPFLSWLIRDAARFGIQRFLIVAGHLGHDVARFAAERPALDDLAIAIETVVEPKPGGTGGALHFVRGRLEDRFLLLNGDSWADIDLIGFWRDANALFARNNVLVALALRRTNDARRYGVVRLEQDRVVEFLARPLDVGPQLVHLGLSAIKRDFVDRIPGPCSLERDILPPAAAQGIVAGSVTDGYFIDIGVPEDYRRAQEELPRSMMRPATLHDRTRPL